MKVKSESEVAQSCPTLSDPMDCSLPGSSVHGIFPGKSTGMGCHCLLQMNSLISIKQTHRYREQTHGCWGDGMDGLGVWDYQVQTSIYTMDKQQGPTV